MIEYSSSGMLKAGAFLKGNRGGNLDMCKAITDLISEGK